MHRTTLYIDDSLHERIRRLAESTGRSQAAVIREAIEAGLGEQKMRPYPRSIGIADGDCDLSERVDEILATGFGTDAW